MSTQEFCLASVLSESQLLSSYVEDSQPSADEHMPLDSDVFEDPARHPTFIRKGKGKKDAPRIDGSSTEVDEEWGCCHHQA